MSLSAKDLTKIRVAFREVFEELFNKKLENSFIKRDMDKLKKKVYDIADIVAGIRNELDTEHEIRLFQIDNNTKQLEDHEVRIQTLEKSKTS